MLDPQFLRLINAGLIAFGLLSIPLLSYRLKRENEPITKALALGFIIGFLSQTASLFQYFLPPSEFTKRVPEFEPWYSLFCGILAMGVHFIVNPRSGFLSERDFFNLIDSKPSGTYGALLSAIESKAESSKEDFWIPINEKDHLLINAGRQQETGTPAISIIGEKRVIRFLHKLNDKHEQQVTKAIESLSRS